ncbi:MAG: hypothetical protein H6869_08525 [Rhodospirillales bacterium]|nr:hypothetical protein [Rhodospirillales bacterium]
MDEQTRLKAREFLLRAKIYRAIALAFAIGGLVVFLALYFKHVDGHIMAALHNPKLVLILLLPFLPAFVVSRMAVKAEKNLSKILETLQAGDPQGDNKK